MTMNRFMLSTTIATLLLCIPCFATVDTTLSISDGVNTLTLTDMGGSLSTSCVGTCSKGTDIDTGANNTMAVFGGSVGQFTISSLTAQGSAVTSSYLENTINTDFASSGVGTLTITYTSTDFAALDDNNIVLAGSGQGSTFVSGGGLPQVTFSAAGSSLNADPATTLIGSLPTLSGASFSTSGIFADPIAATGGSLTETISISFSSASTVDTTFSLANAPEPAGIILMGTILLGITRVIGRKRIP